MDSSNIPIIAGAVGGILVIVIVLLAIWYYLEKRRSKAPSRQLYLTSEPKRTSSSRSTLPTMTQTSSPSALHSAGERRSFLADAPPSPRSNVLSKTSKQEQRATSADKTKRLLASLEKQANKENKLRPPPLPISRSNFNAPAISEPAKLGSLKRAFSVRSADSASIYSVASATPTVHEQAFKPWRLATIPASPTSPTTPPSARVPLSRRTNLISTIQESLAPETYDRLRVGDKLTQGRRISGNVPAPMNLDPASISPISPMPISPPPSAAFPDYRLSSASHCSQQHLLLPPTPTSPMKSAPPLGDVRSQWIS